MTDPILVMLEAAILIGPRTSRRKGIVSRGQPNCQNISWGVGLLASDPYEHESPRTHNARCPL